MKASRKAALIALFMSITLLFALTPAMASADDNLSSEGVTVSTADDENEGGSTGDDENGSGDENQGGSGSETGSGEEGEGTENPTEPGEGEEEGDDPVQTIWTITFDANGGTLTSASTMTTDGAGILTELPSEPTYAGYSFNGWFDAIEGDNHISVGSHFDGDATVYAHWTEIPVEPAAPWTITFNANGGLFSNNSDTLSYNTDTAGYLNDSTVETPTLSNNNFAGWYDDATDGNLISSWNFSSNTTVYAHWTEIPSVPAAPWTITVNANGGQFSDYSDTMSVNTDDNGQLSVTALAVPTRTDYSFVGWFYGAEDGAQQLAGDVVTFSENAIIYAHWNMLPTYTITFDPAGGTMSVSNTVVTNTSGYLPNLPAVDPTRDGYRFQYWKTIAGAQVFTSTQFTADTTVYAEWEALPTYTITFDPAGGTLSGSNALVTNTDGYLTSLSIVDPTRYGYRFLRWETSEGTQVSTSMQFTADTTVYAQWAELPKVHFVANGGTLSGTDFMYTNTDGYLTSLPSTEPLREGYTFKGWFDAAEDGNEIEVPLYCATDVTVYAQWTKDEVLEVTYNVTFNAGDGVLEGASSMTTNQYGKLDSLPTASRDGYAFDCWAFSDDTRVSLNTKFGADAELHPLWIKLYTITINPDEGSYEGDATLQTDKNGMVASKPSDPTKDGYTFLGWYDAETGAAIDWNAPFVADTEAVAKWEKTPVVDPDPINPDPIDPDPVDPDPITPDPVAPTYKVLEGENSVWVAETGAPLEIRVDGEFSNFDHLVLNGSVVDPANYTVREGSTIVSLAHSYLATLPEGTHELEFVYKDGNVAKTSFTTKQAVYVPGNDSNVANDNGEAAITQVGSAVATDTADSDTAPKTGDENGMMLIVLMIGMLAALGTLKSLRIQVK